MDNDVNLQILGWCPDLDILDAKIYRPVPPASLDKRLAYTVIAIQPSVPARQMRLE